MDAKEFVLLIAWTLYGLCQGIYEENKALLFTCLYHSLSLFVYSHLQSVGQKMRARACVLLIL